jgi:hypothetical protein
MEFYLSTCKTKQKKRKKWDKDKDAIMDFQAIETAGLPHNASSLLPPPGGIKLPGSFVTSSSHSSVLSS